MHGIALPLPVIAARARESHTPISMSLPIFPITFVERAVRPLVSASTCHFVHVEFTLVDVALSHFVVALAMAVTILPLTIIATPIGVEHLAIPASLVLEPFSIVVCAIRPRSLTFSVAQVAKPLALV